MPDTLAIAETATLIGADTSALSKLTVFGVEVLRLVIDKVVAPLLSEVTLTGDAALVSVAELRSLNAVTALL